MKLPVEYYIALKYLLAKRKQTFISIITIISIAGVTVGVTALIIVLAVMSGFEKELKDRILGATAHVHVTNLDGSIEDPFAVTERVRKIPGVAGASPYIFSQTTGITTPLIQGANWPEKVVVARTLLPGSTCI